MNPLIINKYQDLELWDAWIEFDPLHSSEFGTLYIVGEVLCDKASKPSIFKRDLWSDTNQLVLEITAAQSSNPVVQEVIYCEQIEKINTYSSVVIYMGEEVLTRIEEIDVII